MAKRKSVGDRIIDSLREHIGALKSGDDSRYTVTTVELDLNPTVYTPARVKKVREILNCSQTIFAKFIGVSPKTVQSWERGASAPNGMAARFLDEIQHDPVHWQNRVKESFRRVAA